MGQGVFEFSVGNTMYLCWTCIRSWWMDVFELYRRAGVSNWQGPIDVRAKVT